MAYLIDSFTLVFAIRAAIIYAFSSSNHRQSGTGSILGTPRRAISYVSFNLAR